MVRERDELKDALMDIERRMRDIQDNTKLLSAERDKFIALFEQVSLEYTVSPSCCLMLLTAQLCLSSKGSRGAKTSSPS